MAYPPFAYMEPAIAQGESGGDWNALYNFVNREGGLFGDTRVSDMTINEVLDFQRTGSPYATYVTDILGYKSTPVGRYQIVGDTLEWAKGKLGLTGEEKFDPATQRQIAEYIYNTQGPSAWEALKGTQMADQVTPQQMAPQQAAGYQPFSPENLSRSQRTMLGFAALRDAAAALRGNQTSFFSEALGGLQQEHKYGQELAFRQGQEQRLIDERAAAASQSAVASQLRAAEALAQVRQQLQWSPNDPTLLALEQSLMAQALGPSGMMPATAPAGAAPAGAVPAAGAEPAAQPVSLPDAVTDANDPSKLDDAQLSAAMTTLSASNDPRAVEALNVLRGEAAKRATAAQAGTESAAKGAEQESTLRPRLDAVINYMIDPNTGDINEDLFFVTEKLPANLQPYWYRDYVSALETINSIVGMRSLEDAKEMFKGVLSDRDIAIIFAQKGTFKPTDPIGTFRSVMQIYDQLGGAPTAGQARVIAIDGKPVGGD